MIGTILVLVFLCNKKVSQPNTLTHSFYSKVDYFSSTAACAAAKRAIGTRNGEQDA
jgi:hypothetical protein